MGTVGEQLLGRASALEQQLSDIQLAGLVTEHTTALREIRESFQVLQDQFQQLQANTVGAPMGTDGPRKQFMSQKELMPNTLSDKDKWRLWSYKALDFLSQWDSTLN